MAENEGKVEGTEGVVEDNPTTPKVTPPTAEEQLATLQQEHEVIKTKLVQTEKGLNTAQATLTRKDLESKSQAGLASRIDGIEDSMQILAGMISKCELSPEDTQGYKQEFASLKKQRDETTKQAESQARQQAYAVEAQAVFKEAQEVFKDNPEELERIEDALDLGKIDRAKSRIERTKGGKKESEADMKARLKKELQAESGDLDSEDGKPSGGNKVYTAKQIEDMPMEQYAKEKVAIDAAQLAGKIK